MHWAVICPSHPLCTCVLPPPPGAPSHPPAPTVNGHFVKPFLGARPPRWDSTLPSAPRRPTLFTEMVATCVPAGVLLTVRSRVGPSTVYASPALAQLPGSPGVRPPDRRWIREESAFFREAGWEAGGSHPRVGTGGEPSGCALPASLSPSSRCVLHS